MAFRNPFKRSAAKAADNPAPKDADAEGPPAPAAAPKVADENKSVAYLLTSFTVLAAVLTALGITGGVAGRMARNESTLTLLAFFCALLAVICAAVAASRSGDTAKRLQFRLFAVGVLSFALAIGFAIAAAVRTWALSPVPKVTASVEQTPRGQVIVLSSEAAGLHADQRLSTTIWPVGSIQGPIYFNGQVVDNRFDYEVQGLPIYVSANGPNNDGDVTLSTKVPLGEDHPGLVLVRAAVESEAEDPAKPPFDPEHVSKVDEDAILESQSPTPAADDPSHCFDNGNQAACITLDLGQPVAPALDAVWLESGGSHVLDLKIGGDQSLARRLYVRVFAKDGQRASLISKAELPVSQGQATTRELQIPVPGQPATVCAVAGPLPLFSGCPPTPHPNPASTAACVADRLRHQSEEGGDTSAGQFRAECRASAETNIAQTTSFLRMRVPEPAASAGSGE